MPLPVVLRESGRYFKRSGAYEKAYRCYSLLQNLEPQSIDEFLEGLPSRELCRFSPWIVRRLVEGPRPGHHWFLQPIKEVLTSELGPEAAALAFAQMVWREPGWKITRMKMAGLRDFAEAHGSVYEELSPSTQVRLPPPPIFGDAPRQGVEATARTLFFSILPDVIVSSKSNFLLAGDRALLDYQRDELEKVPLDLDVDPIVIAPEDDEVTVLVDKGALSGPDLEQAFPLVGVNTNNFGHWLLEFLPKVLACLERPGFNSVPLLIDDQMPSQHREALRLFVGPDHPVIVLKRFEAVRVRRLWVSSMIAYVPLCPKVGFDHAPDSLALDGGAFAALIAKTRAKLEESDGRPGPDRVYLTRKDSQHRSLVNRPEVENWFATRGFEVVDFGELPFGDQLALTRGADMLIAQDGSSMMMSFFARRGTRVGCLTGPYAESNEWYSLMCEALDQPYSILTGELVTRDPVYRERSSYRIDTGTLQAFLDDLLAIS